MVVLDQFYQIVEKNTSRVSSFWKVTHTFVCVVSAICGFLTAFTFGRILANFGYNCVLNAQIVFSNETFLNSSGQRIPAIDLTYTNWGPPSDCSFAQFTPLVITISAIVWATYFAMMSKGGAGYPTDTFAKPWSVLYLLIFFAIIFLITLIVSSKRLEHGMDEFCAQFKPQFNNTVCVRQINLYVNQFVERGEVLLLDFYPNVMVAYWSTDIGIWSWVVQLFLCVARICLVVDFDLQLVTINLKEEEHLENVVDLTDDDDETSEV